MLQPCTVRARVLGCLLCDLGICLQRLRVVAGEATETLGWGSGYRSAEDLAPAAVQGASFGVHIGQSMQSVAHAIHLVKDR
jgi:hypothetical protein